MKGGCIIKEKDSARRKELIEFLKGKGYRLAEDENRGEQEITDSFLPIIVKAYDKTYSMMGNVTCAAAAAASGCFISVEEFYERVEREADAGYGY